METLWLSQGSLLEDMRAIGILSSNWKQSLEIHERHGITTKTWKQIDGIRDGCRPVNSFSRCCHFSSNYTSVLQIDRKKKFSFISVCLTFQLKTKEQVSTLKMVPFGCFVKNLKAPFPQKRPIHYTAMLGANWKENVRLYEGFNIFIKILPLAPQAFAFHFVLLN